MPTRDLFHGTNGDNILSIIASGHINPGRDGATIYFARFNWENVLAYGADRKRSASFVGKLRVTFPTDAGTVYTEVPGVRDTLEVTTKEPLPAVVLELYVRTRGDDGFEFDRVTGEDAIRAYLSSGGGPG